MIASLAIATSIPPADLLAEDPEMLSTLLELLSERGRRRGG